MFVNESLVTDTLVLVLHLIVCVYIRVCACVLACLFIYKQNLLFFRPPTEAIPQASAAYSRLA